MMDKLEKLISDARHIGVWEGNEVRSNDAVILKSDFDGYIKGVEEELETLKAKSKSIEAVIEWASKNSGTQDEVFASDFLRFIPACELIEFLTPQAGDNKDSEL